MVGLAACRVTTAVTWSWLPRFRTTLRPGPLAPLAVGAGAVVGVARPLLGAAALTTASAVAVAEAVLLRRLVRQVLMKTSRGAG